MKDFYNLLFKGVETNKTPLELSNEEFEEFQKNVDGKLFELVLHPNRDAIKWFKNLSANEMVEIWNKHNFNLKDVSLRDIVIVHGLHSKTMWLILKD